MFYHNPSGHCASLCLLGIVPEALVSLVSFWKSLYRGQSLRGTAELARESEALIFRMANQTEGPFLGF